MTITEGLFQLDMIDHHAVLGFSLADEPKQVRKRYLRVARKLHPDSLREASPAQQRLASELLSKLVNPAYEALSQEKPAKEHKILLKMKQEQLTNKPALVELKSNAARNLLDSRSLERDYKEAIAQVAATQFDDLANVEAAIGQLSELNTVYLRRKPIEDNNTAGSTQPQQPQFKKAPRRRQDPVVESYLNRAREFEAQKDYDRGILELRQAIAAKPQSAPCYAELAHLYLKSGQETLAKINAKQALALSPDNETAKKVQSRIARAQKKAAAQAQSSKKGGLLSGLFGKKK